MQRLITSLKFVNKNVIYCTWVVSLIISDQEDENIWKILAMEN